MMDVGSQKRSVSELPPVGAVVGSYRLESVICDGGMGRIYKAVHTRIGRFVALKILRPSKTVEDDVRHRFFCEAQVANRIQHENLISVTDFVEDETAFSYYVMEYLPGCSLREEMDRTGVMPLSRIGWLLLQLTDVLTELHAAGVVHRDLTPDNVYIVSRSTTRDIVKLIDFGVARILDDTGEVLLPKEQRGLVIGTPHYMAPEQAAGKPVDGLADIYALGVMMYELVTGTLPVDVDHLEDLAGLAEAKCAATPRKAVSFSNLETPITSELSALIMECLECNPAKRPPNMLEVRLRLQALNLTGESPPSDETTASRNAALEQRRSWFSVWRVAMTGAAMAALAAVSIHFAWPSRGQSDPPSNANEIIEPLRVGIHFVSEPTGAAILDEGKELGRTDLHYSIEAGVPSKTIEFRLPGYTPVTRVVDFEQNSEVRVAMEPLLEPEPETDDEPAEQLRQSKRRNKRLGRNR